MEVKARSKRLADLKAYLEAEKERLEQDIAEAEMDVPTDENRAGYGNHMADDATEVFEQEKSAGRRRDQQILLDQVTDALQRIENGTYGFCTRCGRPIDSARLRALPTASLCYDCKAREETR
ncbi:MAG: conjugal transfer protein TraR [Chloroflexi bacterium]|jgi:DnaK suppressor protein|nr:conjugal transfer protein TraR [Chloroflexota bacterium]